MEYTKTRPQLRRPAWFFFEWIAEFRLSLLPIRKYKYNTKKLQHWVENEWTGTDTSKTTQGSRKQVDQDAIDLDKEAAELISDMEDDAEQALAGEEEEGGGEAQPFRPEALSARTHLCGDPKHHPPPQTPSKTVNHAFQETVEAVEKAMSDLLARTSKMHDLAGKLRAPYNPDPSSTHTRQLT